jgi:hypothetical protein
MTAFTQDPIAPGDSRGAPWSGRPARAILTAILLLYTVALFVHVDRAGYFGAGGLPMGPWVAVFLVLDLLWIAALACAWGHTIRNTWRRERPLSRWAYVTLLTVSALYGTFAAPSASEASSANPSAPVAQEPGGGRSGAATLEARIAECEGAIIEMSKLLSLQGDHVERLERFARQSEEHYRVLALAYHAQQKQNEANNAVISYLESKLHSAASNCWAGIYEIQANRATGSNRTEKLRRMFEQEQEQKKHSEDTARLLEEYG